MMLTKGKKCVADVLSRVEGEVTTDRLVDLLEEAGYWTEEYDRRAERKAKKYDARVLLRKIHYDSDGRRIEFMHIEKVRDPKTGKMVNIYKQLRFFEDDDFVQAASNYYQRGAYCFDVVKRLVVLATEKCGPAIQARFAFIDTDANGNISIVF